MLLPALICLAGVIAAAVYFWPRGNGASADDSVLVYKVERLDFEAFTTEPGDVTSAGNVEIRCKVRSRGSAGTAILKIVEEGTIVKQGDFLVQFDDSVLENEKLAQQIIVANDKAALTQAESDLETAKKTLEEFQGVGEKKGVFRQECEILEGEQFVAVENLRRSEMARDSSKRLWARGLITKLQLAADEFAVKKAMRDVAVAERKLEVYQGFTKDKLVGQYKAEIKKHEAKVEAAQYTLKLSEQKLKETEDQINNCTLTAPRAGQVVYANQRDGRDGPAVIEEGTVIRDNQIVIRLPDLDNMQVEVKINESHVNHVKPGQRAEIELDADPENLLQGEVVEVAPYPFPVRWHGAPTEYGTTVKIVNPPSTLRPGLRAKVRIIFKSEPEVLQVPLAAVIEHGERHYCLVREPSGWRPQTIRIGPNNNTHVVVESGLSEEDRVALTPFRHIKRSDLPGESAGLASSRRKPSDDRSVSSRPSAEKPKS